LGFRKRGDQALISISTILKFSALEIKKKRGTSINSYIHHSKVPSSEQIPENFSGTIINNKMSSALNIVHNI